MTTPMTTLRIRPDLLHRFQEIAADRGSNASVMLREFVVKTIKAADAADGVARRKQQPARQQ